MIYHDPIVDRFVFNLSQDIVTILPDGNILLVDGIHQVFVWTRKKNLRAWHVSQDYYGFSMPSSDED